jgi:hypothetical protein
MFDRIVWKPDRMLLGDLVFRLQHYSSENWDGGDHFLFYKIRGLVDQYGSFFRGHPHFLPEYVLELGTFDGGSAAFWFELFQPQKHVAIDWADREDSPYFRRYVESRNLSTRIKTFWKTDQSDKVKLRGIVASEFSVPLDLVIDDASHLYGPTKASFEALFPKLRTGGLYIIEDWAWGHWPEFIAPEHPWAGQEPLTKLVQELIEAAGTSQRLIASITVYQGFVSIERGQEIIEDAACFRLNDHIIKRPKWSFTTRMLNFPVRARRILSKRGLMKLVVTRIRSRLRIRTGRIEKVFSKKEIRKRTAATLPGSD